VLKLTAATVYRIAAAALCLATIVVVFRVLVAANPTTVALTLLLYILVLAARWGLRYAVVVSIAAAACFNFFFLPPVGTFTIAETQNWVALLAFLGTSIFASQLSSRIRAEASQAQARERELAMLFELSRALLQTDKVAELLQEIPDCVRSAAQATAVVLYVERGEQLFQTRDLNPADLDGVEPKIAMRFTAVQISTGAGWSILPVRTGIRPRGVLLIRDITASVGTCESLARLVSIAIDRAEALEKAARSEAAKESERLRAGLLDSITHELKTPLTAIKASATALMSAQHITPENRLEMLTVIDEECDRLDGLIAQAVQMGQLEASGIQMRVAPCAVMSLIEATLDACALPLAAHEVQIDVADECPLILVDSEWIERALQNVLMNAAKYSPRGKLIRVTAKEVDGFVAISVTDEGPGIDPAEQELIFQRFYRGERLRSRVPGTGLGLAICREVATAHQGTIAVANDAGHGAKFTLALPIAR
jgi:two-component system sensor histidine kinase KdpD